MRAPRSPISMFVGQDEGGPFGLTVNMSQSGMLLETEERPPVGTTHTINLVWGEDIFECDIRVARHADVGLGVAFIDPQPGFVAVVSEMLSDQV